MTTESALKPVDEMSNTEVQEEFLHAEASTDTLHRQLENMRVKMRANIQQDRALNLAGENEMMKQYNELVDEWLESLGTGMRAIALRTYSITEMRLLLELRRDYPELFEKSARCQLEASLLADSMLRTFNDRVSAAYTTLKDFRRYRY